MEEAAEPVAAVDFAARRLRRRFAGVGWLKLERSVRPLGVVVVDVDAEHVFEVAAVEDQ